MATSEDVEEAERNAHVEDHTRQAKQYKQSHKVKDAPPITSKCTQLGSTYGVGIGLYFQTISWLRMLLLWLALASVPYIIVINTSQFTTADYKGVSPAPGVTVLPSFNPLQSFTFAAIMDDWRDQGVLAWMNIQLPGFDGVFTMSRPLFLGWISLVDAGSMAVFSVACMVLYKYALRFVQEVDDSTMEVADYTVVIKGLPETTPIDIGKHFSRHGKVMDVVMVKDFGPLLSLAATATALEQQRRVAEERKERGHNAVAYQRQVKASEDKMTKFLEEANKQLDTAGFELKAVFVTFNTQGECAACRAASPKRWISSWLQPRSERFLGKYRYWVEQAKPPEDYLYENLHYSRVARYIRMAAVRLFVLAILLVSAAAVTKLMAINISSARNIIWSTDDMIGNINTAMQAYPLNSTQIPQAPALANATLEKIAAAIGTEAAAPLLAPDAYSRLTYCSIQLKQRCSERLGAVLKTKLMLEPAEHVTFVNYADTFLKAKDFYDSMRSCSEQGTACTYAMCYPCYCSLLSSMAPAAMTDTDWVYSTRQECSTFINALDMKSAAMKAVISGVIVILNIVLKQVLQVLVRFEKHWTQSEQESAYAVLAFVSQLLNSVLVLLLVNARSSASATINASLSSNQKTSWGANLVLSGAYPDFSAAWYVDVGQSLQLIVILNAVLTAVFAWLEWAMRKMRQGCLTNCVVTASQAMYNSAWLGSEFVLDYRVSDMMLGLWIILMFGSGMPGLYIYGICWLSVVDLTDRWYITKMCKQPVRYGKSLPYLLLGVLPWAAATHCAFGLWMHTHFNAGSDQNVSDLANSAGDSFAALAQSDIGMRITQLNGLPLLILLIAHLTIHVLIRSLMYFFSGKAFACCSDEDHDGPEIEVTYESALLATYSKGSGRRKLAGTPTYRMPHHPRYKDWFENPMYKPVWFKAFGRLRYTQLVSRPGGGFQISPEVILRHDEQDMQDTLAGMSEDLQKVARKLADDEGNPSTQKKRRSTMRTSLTGVMAAMRDKSQSVNIAVLAGLHSPTTRSAEPSFSGDSPKGPPRASSMAEATGSFSIASPLRAGSIVAPEAVVMSQQQSFMVPSVLAGGTAGYPGMYNAESAAQLAAAAATGMAADPRMSAVLPQLPAFAVGPDATAVAYYPEDGMLAAAPGMGGLAAGASINCYPPYSVADAFGGAEIQPATSLNCYPPCGMPVGYGSADTQLAASLNCYPACAAPGAGYAPGEIQPGNGMLLADPPGLRQPAEIANTMQSGGSYSAMCASQAVGGDVPRYPLGVAAATATDAIGWGISGPVAAPPTPGIGGCAAPRVSWLTGAALPNPNRQSFVWDGVMAAAAAAAAHSCASGMAGSLTAWAGTETIPQQPAAAAAAAASDQAGMQSAVPGIATVGVFTSDAMLSSTTGIIANMASSMESSSIGYPAVRLDASLDADAATAAYPNVHLTTVEMPAPYASPACPAASAATVTNLAPASCGTVGSRSGVPLTPAASVVVAAAAAGSQPAGVERPEGLQQQEAAAEAAAQSPPGAAAAYVGCTPAGMRAAEQADVAAAAAKLEFRYNASTLEASVVVAGVSAATATVLPAVQATVQLPQQLQQEVPQPQAGASDSEQVPSAPPAVPAAAAAPAVADSEQQVDQPPEQQQHQQQQEAAVQQAACGADQCAACSSAAAPAIPAAPACAAEADHGHGDGDGDHSGSEEGESDEEEGRKDGHQQGGGSTSGAGAKTGSSGGAGVQAGSPGGKKRRRGKKGKKGRKH